MRRRTQEINKELSDHVLRTTKKYSCQSKPKMASAGQLYHQYKVNFDFAYSEAVAKLFLEDLMQSLEAKFRKVQEMKYFNSIIQNVQDMQHQLIVMFDPISEDNKMKVTTPFIQKQPLTATIQVYCGGKTIQCDHKSLPEKRPSIALSGYKDETKQNITSKQQIMPSYSSKCLIRLSKEQKMQRNRSMQALKLQSLQPDDKYDELIKQKIFKQNVLHLTTSLFNPKHQTLDKTNSKFNANLAIIDQYSFDYDGSAIPIKKFTRAFPEKMKILNPIYKVPHKDVFESRKAKNSRYDYLQSFRLQGEQSKPKVQNAQVHQLNLGIKGSARQLTNQLSGQTKQELDFQLRANFQQLLKAKSIRIRQLKQV